MAYFFDPALFGNPQYGMAINDEPSFLSGEPQNVGFAEYRLSDDFAPTAVQLTWWMSGDVLDQFRGVWDDPTKLNYGNAWFDIPLPLGTGGPATLVYDFKTYRAHFTGSYRTTLIGYKHWRVEAVLEIDNHTAPVAA